MVNTHNNWRATVTHSDVIYFLTQNLDSFSMSFDFNVKGLMFVSSKAKSKG